MFHCINEIPISIDKNQKMITKTRLYSRYRARRSYYFRTREYFIIPGGIARTKRGVPKLETVFLPASPRPAKRGSAVTSAPGDGPRDTLALAGATRCVTLLRRRFSSGTNVGVAAARGPPFFRDSLARPLLHARPVLYSLLSSLHTCLFQTDRKLFPHIWCLSFLLNSRH